MEQSPAKSILEQYTIKELLLLAELEHVKGRSRLTKAQLIEELIQSGYRAHGNPEDPNFKRAVKAKILKFMEMLSLSRTFAMNRLSIDSIEAEDIGLNATPLFEELESSMVIVEERQEGGVVPELLLTKKSPGRTIMLEGEPLIGGNQDRILNTTIIIEGVGKIIVPVTCVEAGRWAFSSARFSSSRYHSYSSSRSILSRSLTSSLRARDLYRSDQSIVWRAIGSSLRSSGTDSRTNRMSDMFEKHKEELEKYEKDLRILPRQIGYAASVDGVPIAFEIFGTHETFGKYWQKLFKGLAMEALLSPDIRSRGKHPRSISGSFMSEILSQTVFEIYQSLGKGKDVRITGRNWQGSALFEEDRLEHIVLHRG